MISWGLYSSFPTHGAPYPQPALGELNISWGQLLGCEYLVVLNEHKRMVC